MAKAPTVMNTSNNHTGARPAPTRVRPFEITQKLPRLQKMVFGKQLAPTRERYDQLVDALWQGDEPMDTLLDWIMEGNARERRGMYDKAVKEGLKLHVLGRQLLQHQLLLRATHFAQFAQF